MADYFLVDVRTETTAPVQYKLVRKNGELVLYGYYQWHEGMKFGAEWREIPTEEADDGK